MPLGQLPGPFTGESIYQNFFKLWDCFLQEGPRTMIGIATYDSTIQFYNLKLTLQEVYWNLILVAGYVYLLIFVLPYVHELQLCALVFVGGEEIEISYFTWYMTVICQLYLIINAIAYLSNPVNNLSKSGLSLET